MMKRTAIPCSAMLIGTVWIFGVGKWVNQHLAHPVASLLLFGGIIMLSLRLVSLVVVCFRQ